MTSLSTCAAPGASTTVYFSTTAETLHLTSPTGDTMAYPGDYMLSFTNGMSHWSLLVFKVWEQTDNGAMCLAGVEQMLTANLTVTGTEPKLIEQFVGRE